MEDLAKADAKTIKTFIDNNITAERLLADVLKPKHDLIDSQAKQAGSNKENIARKDHMIFDYCGLNDD